jgi:hypothetical protein
MPFDKLAETAILPDFPGTFASPVLGLPAIPITVNHPVWIAYSEGQRNPTWPTRSKPALFRTFVLSVDDQKFLCDIGRRSSGEQSHVRTCGSCHLPCTAAMRPEETPKKISRLAQTEIISSGIEVSTGASSGKHVTAMGSQSRSGCSAPVAHPSNDTLKSKAKLTRTIRRGNPTSSNAKGPTCRNRSGAELCSAISGVHSSDRTLSCV